MKLPALPLPLAQAENNEEMPKDAAGAWRVVVDSVYEIWGQFLERLPLIVAGLVVLLLTWIVGRIVDRVVRYSLSKTKLRRSLRDLIRQLIYLTIWVVGLLIAAMVSTGLTPSKVLTVLGLSSIAIGFAFKDIVENFFAGALILWRFPFEPGDYIECEDIKGQVEETTIRMTNVRQVDGQLVIVPNAQLFKSPVNVLTSQKKRRITVMCGVDYDTDLDQAQQVLQECVEACDTVSERHAVQIFAQEFGDSSINFEITWWTGSTPLEVRESRDQVVRAVKKALDAADISIPFPHRTHTFKQPMQVVRAESEANEE